MFCICADNVRADRTKCMAGVNIVIAVTMLEEKVRDNKDTQL